jgi:hypothetical protein
MASDGLGELAERAKAPAASFAAYSALGSFILYVLGYLTLRFHLTFLGVATDLGVFDERYLFAGATFLVYLGSSLPIAALLAAVAAALVYAPYRVLPSNARRSVRGRVQRFFASPIAPAALGVVVAFLFIQILMRRCFPYANALVMDRLPENQAWLNALLTKDGWNGYMVPYFSLLIVGVAATAALLVHVRRGQSEAGGGRAPALHWLLGLFVAIQALMLPVNFGVLVHGKSFPRVTAVGNRPLSGGERAWLAWDGKSTVTYLLQHASGRRSLITMDRESIKGSPIEITGYDDLGTVLAPVSPNGPGGK